MSKESKLEVPLAAIKGEPFFFLILGWGRIFKSGTERRGRRERRGEGEGGV